MVEISTLQGKPIWVPHPQEAWVCGTIEKINGNNVVIAIQNGGSFTLSMKEMELADLANPSSLSGNFDNLVNLEEFNQGAIIHQLRIRYSSDTIYTWIGNILISINPFKPLSIYSNETLQKFLKKQKEGPGAFQNPVPHVYALAGLSYQGMSLDKEPQAFVISGESGSGKTETTKLILQYLSECAGSTTGVEQEILQTNPLLESFGNAKTLRNNNSSRFGKWMEIRFDPSGKISASRIVNYLLEKSRVIKQSAQERNYHIFYQMCAGSSTSRPNLSLDDPSYFNYLNQTGCMTIPGVDDEHDYREVISSMEKLGFSSNDIDNVHHIVASVLHLGNLEFSAKGEGSQIPSTIVLNTAAKLLRLTPEQLAKALCVRSVKIRNDTTEILLKPTEASDARHTLAKALFGRLFDWLVKKVNLRLCKSNDSNVIGVLDIFGFEVFQTNSFEQFCINLANEKLQSHFTRHIFFMEQNEYAAEGINVAHVEFSDNEDCIAMIEGNPGVLRMMDEEVFVPKGSDNSLIEKLHKQFWPSDKQHHPKYGIIKKNKNIFIVHHYAGEVEYDITGFLDKNRDTLHDSLADAMKISKLEILSELFSDEEAANVAASPKSKSSRGKITLSGQFKKQLDSLMEILGSAQPHFVRCVKPNVEKIPNKFSSEMILRQMKYAGLFEAIRIRATGFAYRKPFINFFKVYGIILPKSSRLDIEKLKPEEMAKQGCKKLLEALKNDLNDNDIVMGKSKVFLRAAPLTILEMKRNEAISSYAIKGQARARGFLARRRYQKIKSAYDKVKVALERHDFAEMRDCLKYCEENMVQLRIVDELRSIMEFMKHQHRLWELLVNAIKERDINKLEGALSQFEKSDIAKQTKDERILKTIQDGKTLLNQLRNVLRAKQALKLAMQSGDATNLDHAIKDAVKSQLEDSILDQAKEILEQLNKVDKAMKDIVTYTKSLNLEELEKALKDVSKVPLSDDKKKKIDAAEKAILNYYENSITSAGTKNDDEAILHYLKALHESFVAPKSAKLLEKAKKKLDEIYKKKSPEGGQQPAYDESLFVAPKIIQPRRTVRASVFPSALNADMNGSPPPIGDEEDLPPMPDDFEEEELEEDRQERIARDERKILENLKSALRDLDREKMAKFLAKATDMGIGDCKEIIQARELCYGISELQFLDLKIQKALKKKQTVRLKSLLVEANKSGLDSLNFNLARQFISQKLEESRIKISKSGNIRDYSLTFNHYRDLHPFSSFRFLRKNEDFGKKGLFSKRKDPTMYVAVETPIRKSMIDLNLDNCKTKKRVKELNDLAILNFKDLLDFMKLRYHSFPSTLATEIIQRAINEPLMRDETFCQIIKQTSGNSNLQSVIYALKLLLLCLCNFRPLTKDMNEILKSHLASMASPQVTKFTTYDQIEDLAARCFEVMSKPVSSHSIPSQEEVQAFYDSISERLTVKVVLEYDESGKLKHARTEDINYRIPCVSQSIEKLMPYDDGVLTLDDLAINISSRMKLPFIGKIRLENAPAEVIPDGSGVLADTQSLVETLLQIKSAGRSKATDWYLVSEDSNDRPTDAEEEEFEYQINSVTSSNFDDFIPPIDEDLSYPPPPPDPYGFAVRVVYDEDADMDAKIQSSDDEEYDTPVNHLARGVIRKELTEEQKKAEEEEKRKREELEAEEKRKKAEEQRIREQQEIEARKQEMIKKNEENKKKLEQLNRLKEKAAALREQAASATESSNSEELTSEVPGTQESASPVGSSLGSQGTVKLKRPARRAPKPTD